MMLQGALQKYHLLEGSIRNNTIQAFWFTAVPNAGDLVTPFLLRKFGFTPILTDPKNAKLLSCGSVMQRVPIDYCNYIIGSGFLNDGPIVELKGANVLAVRGKLTRERIGASKDLLLGDPGLLMGNFVTKRQKKKYLVGVIPHYLEKNDPVVARFIKKNQKETTLIDIQKSPMHVLAKIDQCEFIISSSLHGNIFADSLHIPNCWVSLSEQKISKLYKYTDYYSALGMDKLSPIPLTDYLSVQSICSKTHMPSVEIIDERKKGLINAFLEFREAMKREKLSVNW